MIVVILGGYGNFGARIARALAQTPSIQLYIAGRHHARAAALASELGSHVHALTIDIAAPDLAEVLVSVQAQLVIHTAGPFQTLVYQVPLAVAKAKAHYIDLADGRRYVCDFPQALQAAFGAADRVAICGASTVPALSSAVVDTLTADWQQLDSIAICIAPAQTAPRGIATLEAVMSYCGRPIQVWLQGRWQQRLGWADPRRISFRRLRPRLGALCDIPDLELFPARYAGVQMVTFAAALEVRLAQYGLAWLARLTQIGLITQPQRLAGLFNKLASSLDFLGSSLGGMVVNVSGLDPAGQPAKRAWHIAADDDHGPEIPCMAAILLARRIMDGSLSARGAHVAMGWLALQDFADEFTRWGMITDIMDDN